MRTIHKNITLPIDGKSYTFRLCKLGAFSGAQLLQLLRKYLPAAEVAAGSRKKVADVESRRRHGLIAGLFCCSESAEPPVPVYLALVQCSLQ